MAKRLLGVLIAASALAATATACTTPPPTQISWTFTNLLTPPGPGVMSGGNANFTYKTSNFVPLDRILLQQASVVGTAIKWSNVAVLKTVAVGTGTILRPNTGRNAYRLAVVDANGKLLASAGQTLDVYKTFTFSQITSRAEQFVKYPNSTLTFPYVFQSEILLEHTSCRSLDLLTVYNAGPNARLFRLTDTINGKSTIDDIVIQASKGNSIDELFYGDPRPVTPGENLDLHILDNNTEGSTVYADGSAVCFTDGGEF